MIKDYKKLIADSFSESTSVKTKNFISLLSWDNHKKHRQGEERGSLKEKILQKKKKIVRSSTLKRQLE